MHVIDMYSCATLVPFSNTTIFHTGCFRNQNIRINFVIQLQKLQAEMCSCVMPASIMSFPFLEG